jgi:hypothetical protein
LSAFLEAASLANRDWTRVYLYQAGLVAKELGDRDSLSRILSRMITEFPDSHLTTLLAGKDFAPVPNI